MSVDYVLAVNIYIFTEILSGLMGWQVWHQITGCQLLVGSTPIRDNAEDQFQNGPGCYTGHRTLTFDHLYLLC